MCLFYILYAESSIDHCNMMLQPITSKFLEWMCMWIDVFTTFLCKFIIRWTMCNFFFFVKVAERFFSMTNQVGLSFLHTIWYKCIKLWSQCVFEYLLQIDSNSGFILTFPPSRMVGKVLNPASSPRSAAVANILYLFYRNFPATALLYSENRAPARHSWSADGWKLNSNYRNFILRPLRKQSGWTFASKPGLSSPRRSDIHCEICLHTRRQKLHTG